MRQLSKSIKLYPMKAEHYDAVYALWNSCKGVRLTESDSRQQVCRYLKRNKGLSSVAICNGEVVGALLCGHDGLKGFIHHIAVAQSHRRLGTGRKLVERSLKLLKKEKIGVCQIVISAANHQGQQFWGELGWHRNGDYLLLTDQEQSQQRSVWECQILPVAA